MESIHCFPNGKSRHSRLMADVIISHVFNHDVFSWGMSNLNRKSEARMTYLNALRKADRGDTGELILFARM